MIMIMKKILLTTMLTIKTLFTINSLEKKKEKTIHSKTLFTIPVDLKSTYFSLKRVNLTKKNLFELKTFHFNKKKLSTSKIQKFLSTAKNKKIIIIITMK